MHLPSRLPEPPSGLRVQISDVLRRKLLRDPENMIVGGLGAGPFLWPWTSLHRRGKVPPPSPLTAPRFRRW